MLRVLLVCLIAVGSLAASQLEPRTLISPVTGKPFNVTTIPVTSGGERVLGVEGAADMGTDSDGCRHSAGVSEYEHYVAVCPYSYFTALTVEYGKDGQFRNRLSRQFKQWVTSADGFNSERVIDKDKFYGRAQRQARTQGHTLPPASDWVIPQQMIPVEKKFRLALFSYKRRDATDSFLGKLALTAAWALRARINKPIMDSRLRPGIEEVNSRLERYVEEGASFDLDTFHRAYRTIFRSASLTDEGYFVAGNAYLGLSLRKGDLAESMGILDALKERFDEEGDDLHLFFRGLVRDRRNTISNDYLGFLDTCSKHLTLALGNEEFPRAKIPETLLVVGETYRRMGNTTRAYDWLLALSDIEESDPRLRAQMREAGRSPNMNAPYPVVLGWRADEALAELTDEGVVHPDRISGPDSDLLQAIVHEGLGSLRYESPTWQPRTDGSQREVTRILRDSGLGVLDFVQRSGSWPQRLGELWTSGIIPDRNRYNRFHCTVTGEPLRYQPIGGEVDGLPRQMVIVATASPVPTNQGPRYGAFLADLGVVWTPEPLEPGALHEP